jgi:RimJ/RimL family protein N-acetyltransferase
VIETDRLILRPWEQADLPILAAFSTDPVLMHHFGRAELVDDSVERLERMQRFDRELGVSFRAVVRKSDGLVIGNCGLKPLTIPWPEPTDIEIGWLFRQDCWGQGYAVEAATPMLARGLELAPRVIAITAASNVASQRVMQKLGMVRENSLDFDHPDVAEGHFARRHVTYVMQRPCTKQTA